MPGAAVALQIGDNLQPGAQSGEGAAVRRDGLARGDSHDQRQAVELGEPGEVRVELGQAKQRPIAAAFAGCR
jgi:hypothetical protein